MPEDIRNESEEPRNVPQEDVRKLRKESDDLEYVSGADIPEELEFSFGLDRVIEELGDISAPAVGLDQNPLSEPDAVEPPVPAGEAMTAAPAKRTGPLRTQPYSQRSREQKRADREARARKERGEVLPGQVSGLNQAMTELGQVSAGSVVPDAVPVQPAQMERGEAERILLPGREQADTLVDAYKAYMQEDKDWRTSLSRLLVEMCSRLRQDRLELDSLRASLERDIV